MRSSRSSSLSEPAVSIVVGSVAPSEALEACLAALDAQRRNGDVEVLVCEQRQSPAALRQRFSWARFLERPGALVPQLWTEGIAESRGEIVALTIAPMVPAEDWVARIREQHLRYDAIAGAIDPGERMRAVDWAEYFCRYANDMLPFEGHMCPDLPGDNAAYKRALLEGTRDLYRDGFWEPVVHRQLAQDGVTLWHTPTLVVRQGRSAGFSAFVRQRLAHGRAHGNQRGTRFSTARNLVGVLAAPLVPLVLSVRILRQVLAKRRHRLRAVAVLPIIACFNLAWAAGEALGHADSLAGRTPRRKPSLPASP